ncbi:MAG: glycosyltransferase family 4 protein [Gemmatimonadaceae bacterium]
MTHPVQYYSPWFRFINRECPEIQLKVIYGTVPTPEQQGVGFGVSFEWDTSPLDGYDFVQLRPSRSDDYLHFDRFFGLDVRGMGRAIRDSRADAVVVPGWYSSTLARALVACRIHRIPTVYRGDTPFTAKSGIRSIAWSLKTKAMLDFFNAYLTVGTRNREYLEHFGVPGSKIHFSPSCVDNEVFSSVAEHTRAGRASARARLGIPDENFAILFVGKLDDNKRPWDVIAAAAALGEKTTAVIVGSGPEMDRTRNEAARLDVHALFPGFINQSALGEVYAAADVCVLSSTSETWGLVVNEALASGTPCIASDGVGCAPDLIARGVTGEIYPVADVSALSGALAQIRGEISRGHNFAEDCRRVASRYSFSTATEGLVAAVRSLVNPRS